ncbi:MAG: FmdB family transcriptional regulator [Deltaproteobacteria bacterium]|nr:FmdB family transcriptional regulator [Deltaproteobacteria bacterium]
MPLYEYECPKCGRFETLQKIGDSPLRTHATCGSRVHKVMSAGNFAFKGSGFYQTDYKASAPSCDKPEKGSSSACASCPAADA